MDKKSLLISPKFSKKDWHDLNLPGEGAACENWGTASKILRDRLYGRFLNPATKLICIERRKKLATYGFAILTLDCLCIETIQGFREGATDHGGKSKQLFTNFLKGWQEFTHCLTNVRDHEKALGAVYSSLRCALHHSGQTDGIVVNRKRDLVVFNGSKLIHINRDKFHYGVKNELDRYLAKIAGVGEAELKRNMKTKMDAICS